MLCVTGKEQRFEDFVGRLESLPEADLHEVRLDHLDQVRPALQALARYTNHFKILATCRPQREGGAFSGSESERFALLEAARQAGAWGLDVESDAPVELVHGLMTQHHSCKIVLSHHVFESGWEPNTLHSRARSMDRLPAHALKLAAMTQDTADLEPFVALAQSIDTQKKLVLVPMGRAGVAGRVYHRALGSAWTYVSANDQLATAPGQLSWHQAKILGMPNPGPLIALMGGCQVHDSFGPKIYNQLLRKAGLDHVYLPAETTRFDDTLRVLAELGLAGAAVTMPHKLAAHKRADQLDNSARVVGAVNTLVHDASDRTGSFRGYNTDGPAVVSALAQYGPLKGLTAVVLGTGGAARAAAWSLKNAGVAVTVLGRTGAHTDALVRELDLRGEPWGALGNLRFDIVINATPVGSDGTSCPVDDPNVLAGKVVMDMVTNPVRTPLLRNAERAGARAAVPGVEMWIRQGLHQLRLWTGREFSAEDIRAELNPHLDASRPAETAQRQDVP